MALDRLDDHLCVPDVGSGHGRASGQRAGFIPVNATQQAFFEQALEADDRVIYNTTTGVLYLDGSGGAAQVVQFAILSTHPDQLSAADFLII